MEKDTVAIETIINAPIERVWKAWTDPGSVITFFGSDHEGWGVKAELDVRPGGKYEVTFANSDGAEHTCSGVYKEVEEFRRLSFTWTWKGEPGVESLVTVVLIPEGNTSRQQFRHAHVGTESAHDYEYGWQQSFLKLEKMLTYQKGG